MKQFLVVIVAVSIFAGTAFADDGMMSPPTMSDSSTMQGNDMTADPAVGNMLRFAPSMGHKVIYTTLTAARKYAEKGPAVLFFAADWCPYCQADLKDINENGSMLGSDVTIIVVNYDKAPDLKRKYGVTAQDTFVQIDMHGGPVAIWNGGGVKGIVDHVVRM